MPKHGSQLQTALQSSIAASVNDKIVAEEIMTDRELLELAAKAAGIQLTNSFISDDVILCFRYQKSGNFESTEQWNPLDDDGDAFRLAVRLEILYKIYICDNGFKVIFGDDFTVFSYVTDYDIYAATRRAITIAAAELGKAMAEHAS